MGKLIYSMHVSLDGYIEDANGGIEFSAPGEDVHRWANDQAKEAAAFLYGRRLYEVMEGHWPVVAERDDVPDVEAEFARAYVQTPRIVFSDTLDSVSDGARLVRSADAAGEVGRLKQQSEGALHVGGASLAASLVDLIDEIQPVVMPVAVGGGKPFLAPGAERLDLQLIDSRVFPSGAVHLHYEPRAGSPPPREEER
jgi:dihydrofolate reductase